MRRAARGRAPARGEEDDEEGASEAEARCCMGAMLTRPAGAARPPAEERGERQERGRERAPPGASPAASQPQPPLA